MNKQEISIQINKAKLDMQEQTVRFQKYPQIHQIIHLEMEKLKDALSEGSE